MRIYSLDFLRGLAVIFMVIYHFFWDLGFFGYIDISLATSGLGLIVAQAIGASFIFISGVSLSLYYFSSKFLSKFWFRLLKLFLISCLISIVTLVFDRNNFIFFGILHLLTICSLIGLILFKFNNQFFYVLILTMTLAISFYDPSFELPVYLSWIGLSASLPNTNDFYPIFPWINFYILGCWLGSLSNAKIIKSAIYYNNRELSFIYKWIVFFGKKSLTLYILHQPVFFSLFLIFNSIVS